MRKSIRSIYWRLRPWTLLKQREELIEQLRAKLKMQQERNKAMEASLTRKRNALNYLQQTHDNAIAEFRRQRCTKIKHSSRGAALKAAARLQNKTSHVMEPYECYICPEKNSEIGEKWWHIRHAVRSERGKNGQVGIYRETT